MASTLDWLSDYDIERWKKKGSIMNAQQLDTKTVEENKLLIEETRDLQADASKRRAYGEKYAKDIAPPEVPAARYIQTPEHTGTETVH
jgi:hypothetical protein